MNDLEISGDGLGEQGLMRIQSAISDPLRISVYIYRNQLQILDEICRKRRKPRRMVFLEAFQSYIGSYWQGEV